MSQKGCIFASNQYFLGRNHSKSFSLNKFPHDEQIESLKFKIDSEKYRKRSVDIINQHPLVKELFDLQAQFIQNQSIFAKLEKNIREIKQRTQFIDEIISRLSNCPTDSESSLLNVSFIPHEESAISFRNTFSDIFWSHILTFKF